LLFDAGFYIIILETVVLKSYKPFCQTLKEEGIMERKIVYGAGRPHFESNVVLLLNSFFRLLFLVAKFFLFIGRLPFAGGIDNKKIIKE